MTMLLGTRRALLAGTQKAFCFDPDLVVFSPSMAKRTGTVFAAAPIVQGNWDGTSTPDRLSFARGTQVSGHWYDNFDVYQGGGVCTWTPEQSSADRSDARTSYIWYVSSAYYLTYQWDSDRYLFLAGGKYVFVNATITAGIPEYLAWGFDTNNDLDGTNYLYLSRNNVQTYSGTTKPTATAPGATISVGSTIIPAAPSNGIIEGLVFMRRVPTVSGGYGTNVGNADEVGDVYNG